MKYIPVYNHFTQKNCTNIIDLCIKKLFSINKLKNKERTVEKEEFRLRKNHQANHHNNTATTTNAGSIFIIRSFFISRILTPKPIRRMPPTPVKP